MFVILTCSTKGQIMSIGVQPGDWMKYNVSFGQTPSTPYAVWYRFEVLTVFAKSNDIIEIFWSAKYDNDNTIYNETHDLEPYTESFSQLKGTIIPPNLNIGDIVHLYGNDVNDKNVPIEGETTKYIGNVARIAVYATHHIGTWTETFYWDKETGVMIEVDQDIEGYGTIDITRASITTNIATLTISNAYVTSFPLLQLNYMIYLAIAVAITVVIVIGVHYYRKKH